MAVTVDSITTRVKQYNGDLRTADDTRIIQWQNDEMDYLTNRVRLRRDARINYDSATDDLVASQELYELPDDLVEIDTVQFEHTDGTFKIAIETDRKTIRKWDQDSKSFAGEYYFALRNDYMVIRGDFGTTDGKPGATTTGDSGIRIDYWKLLARLASGGNIPRFLDRWSELLVLGSAKRSYFRKRDWPKEFNDQYLLELALFVKDAPRRSSSLGRMRDLRNVHSMKSLTRRRFGRVR